MKKMTWKEKSYGGYDGKATIGCNNTNGWEADKAEKEKGREPYGIFLQYEHVDGEGGTTELTYEEVKSLRDRLSEYIEFMEY